MYLLASKLDAGGLNLCPLETSKNHLGVVFLLAVNSLGHILQGHLWLLMKFPIPS